mmetsp:Transcript_4631/g.7183  ORF Transcript_4631/g.7183 Transcript_4631/m.7183 type:complete len:123 (+) Transcript_4631:38-406(+)
MQTYVLPPRGPYFLSRSLPTPIPPLIRLFSTTARVLWNVHATDNVNLLANRIVTPFDTVWTPSLEDFALWTWQQPHRIQLQSDATVIVYCDRHGEQHGDITGTGHTANKLVNLLHWVNKIQR